ncbi:MAG: hypothetical protein P9E88_18915 [Candidatus Competibacter sp.]|nr:hypothetical protein [Candidatus Competibacter sp.]
MIQHNTWFERLTGFNEATPHQVRENLRVEGDTLTSLVNGKTYVHGCLETPSLLELRNRVTALGQATGRLSLREIVADVTELHTDPVHAGSLFQVASQFNLLEMISPRITPEQGVGIYENDPTQGPACAIAAGAGTIYRNYFVRVKGHIGQSAHHQIDCLADVGKALDNASHHFWKMKNGYVLALRGGLGKLSSRLAASSEDERDRLRQLLRIGLQWNTQVTLKDCQHRVTQAYCSALPVAYFHLPAKLWEHFARLVLDASYEATLCAAILNAQHTGNRRAFLTLLGGGVFGNDPDWIWDAIERALKRYERHDLEVAIVSYGVSNHAVRQLIRPFASP